MLESVPRAGGGRAGDWLRRRVRTLIRAKCHPLLLCCGVNSPHAALVNANEVRLRRCMRTVRALTLCAWGLAAAL
ncbi:MAG: hypothetical protein ACK4UX_13180, partial [Thiobacillus sp.]